MLGYLSAPYSRCEDKAALMDKVMTLSGRLMVQNPGLHVVSPLMNHFSLHLVPDLGSDYKFWGEYSRELLSKCNVLIVYMLTGWNESTGVADEIEQAAKLGIQVLYVHED